jgi:MFS family permease
VTNQQTAPARGVTQSGTFTSLQHPMYRLLFVSGVSIGLATTVQLIARGWLARDLTGSNAGLGGVYLGFGVPMLLATPFGGVASDRFRKRTVLLIGQGLQILSASFLAVTLALDATEYWMLVTAAGVQAVGFAFYMPTRVAFTAEAVPPASLPNALALTQMSNSVTQVIGPAAAGLLIGADAIGVKGAYITTAVLAVIGAVVTFGLPPGNPPPGRPARSVVRELEDGVRYVHSSPVLTLIVVLSLFVIVLGFPYMALLPGVADGLFDRGASGYAALTIGGAIGATIVSLLVAKRGGAHGWKIQTISGFTFAAGLFALAIAPVFFAAVAAVAMIGAGAAAFQSMSSTLALTNSSLEYHGRVQSLMFLSFSVFALVTLPVTVLADAIGIRQTLVAMGASMLVVMVVYVFFRRHQLPTRSQVVPL